MRGSDARKLSDAFKQEDYCYKLVQEVIQAACDRGFTSTHFQVWSCVPYVVEQLEKDGFDCTKSEDSTGATNFVVSWEGK